MIERVEFWLVQGRGWSYKVQIEWHGSTTYDGFDFLEDAMEHFRQYYGDYNV